MQDEYFTYILQSQANGAYYFGSTANISARLKVHNEGGSSHTRKYRPWRIVWYGAFDSRIKAEAFERYLKTGSGYAFSRKRFLTRN